MKRLVGREAPPKPEAELKIRKEPALEPAHGIGEGKRRSPYNWTPERIIRLEELAAQKLSHREIAKRLNEEFPDGVCADSRAVAARLSNDVYLRKPDLKRKLRYRWTEERVKRLEFLKAQGLGHKQIARRLNEEFPGDVLADARTIGARLSTEVYKRKPGLRADYSWTPRKVEMLEELAAQRLGHREIAKRLNEGFPGGVRADEWIVMTKLDG